MAKGTEGEKGTERSKAARILEIIGDLSELIPENGKGPFGGFKLEAAKRVLSAIGDNPAAVGEAVAAFMKQKFAENNPEMQDWVEEDLADEESGDVFALNETLRNLATALAEMSEESPLEARRSAWELSQLDQDGRLAQLTAWQLEKEPISELLNEGKVKGRLKVATEDQERVYTQALAALASMPAKEDLKGALATKDELRFKLEKLGIGEDKITDLFRQLQKVYGDVTDVVPESVIFSVLSWIATKNPKVMAIVAVKTQLVDSYVWPLLKPVVLALWEQRGKGKKK